MSTDLTVMESMPERIMSNMEGMKYVAAQAKKYAESDLVPQSYKGKPSECFIACEMALRMNVPVMLVMQSLDIVRGRPRWSGKGCIAIINNSNRFTEPLRFEWIGEAGKDTYGCRAYTKRGDEIIYGAAVTAAMVKGEGWDKDKVDKYTKETILSKWKTMPELMYQYRAAAFFANVHCPDLLMGCAVEGEIADVTKINEEVEVE